MNYFDFAEGNIVLYYIEVLLHVNIISKFSKHEINNHKIFSVALKLRRGEERGPTRKLYVSRRLRSVKYFTLVSISMAVNW
jgi:hypothetical protein